MNKSELIEKISAKAGVTGNEGEYFFELLVKRCADELYDDGILSISDIGRFEYKKSYNEDENDILLFITTDNKELHFDIPRGKESAYIGSVDSYFSISIGKPVISFSGSGDNKSFIPQSEDEKKRMLGLKVEKFIEEISKPEAGVDETIIPEEVSFSFLKKEKPDDLEEEIDKIEQVFDDSYNEEEKFENGVELKNQISEDEVVFDSAAEKTEEQISDEINNDKADDTEKIEEELIEEIPESNYELSGLSEEWGEEIINESPALEEEVPEEISGEFEKSFGEEKKLENPKNDPAIADAFKYAEEKMARLQSFAKKSYANIIFAIAIILATAWLVYLSFFTGEKEKPAVTEQPQPKEFNVIVERSYDIPVSYPYSPGALNVHNAFGELKETKAEDKITQSKSNTSSESSKTPDVKLPQPSTRIKGYIYRYNDGTYAVQVSSWRTKSIALSEVQKYITAGYSAFVEQTSLEGEAYYRVRVGGFESLDEAEKFINK